MSFRNRTSLILKLALPQRQESEGDADQPGTSIQAENCTTNDTLNAATSETLGLDFENVNKLISKNVSNLDTTLLDIENMEVVFQEVEVITKDQHTEAADSTIIGHDLQDQEILNAEHIQQPDLNEAVTQNDESMHADEENVQAGENDNGEEDQPEEEEQQPDKEEWQPDEEERQLDEEEEQSDASDIKEDGNGKGRKKKGRKRKFPSQSRSLRKKCKNSNKAYLNEKGDKVYPKTFRDFHCNCKCNDKVPVEIRKNIFKNFWDLGNYDSQTMYICSQITQTPVKRKRVKDSTKRSYTREYRLNNKPVCKSIFIQTLRVSSKRINTALTKINSDHLKDQRGNRGGYNKLDVEKTTEIKRHIESFPKYKSHYCRSTTESNYLPSDLTLSKMYDLYKLNCIQPASQSSYNKVFYTQFNLKRKPLKKDTCSVCDAYKASLESRKTQLEKENIEAEHNAHLLKADMARKALQEDLKRAKESDKTETLTFDLQKTLPLPRIPTNIVYYKRQIMMYNSGIHSGKLNKGYFYVWVEGTAGRGAQEVGSCLKKHIVNNCDNIEELVLWADSCGGQNRNIKITLFLQHVLQVHPTLKIIRLRFLMPGHSFLPNDSEFGDVESYLKTQQRLYTDDDYIGVMRTCRRKNPFIVTKMKKNEFLSTDDLEKGVTNRKEDTEKTKINWFSFREIEVRKSDPLSFFFKSDFDEAQHREVSIRKKTVGRQNFPEEMFQGPLPELWPNGKPLSVLKIKDIKSMMNLIPSDAKAFYKPFYASQDIVDDIDGYNADLDFAVELE